MNRKFTIPVFVLATSASLIAFAEDPVTEIVVSATKSNNTSTNSTPTQNEAFSKAGGMNSGPGRAEAAAAEAAAEARGKILSACGAKKERILVLTEKYKTCNQTTQVTYNDALASCPEAVADGRTWGIKTKDGTTFGYSREYAQNFGLQCRADKKSIYDSTIQNVCTANYNADKSAEGELSQTCKDAGF